jgi:hypothetical protein
MEKEVEKEVEEGEEMEVEEKSAYTTEEGEEVAAVEPRGVRN